VRKRCDPREIRRLRRRGLSYVEIARKLGCNIKTVYYWCRPKYRTKERERSRRVMLRLWREGRSWRHKHPLRWRRWFRSYMVLRYHSDAEFRAKHLERVRKHGRKKLK